MSDNARAKLQLNNSELWGGLVGLALGVFVIWAGFKLGIGNIHDPGSGFVLFYTGILMCAFAFTIIASAVTEGGPRIGSLWAGTRWSKPLLVVACLLVFAFVFEPLGFLLSSIPLLLLLLRVIDPVRWSLAVPIAVLVPIGVWFVLKHGLSIQLPSGLFGIG